MFKFSLVLLSALVLTCLAGKPHLLVSKLVLNQYQVEGRDLTVRYSLYNIGDGVAQSVMLDDESFPEDEFSLVQGLLTASWDKIAPNTNVSHLVIMKPLAPGFYNVSWAKVTYSSPEDKDLQVAYSSAPGIVHVIPHQDFSRKHEAHLVEWMAFAIMSAPTILLPLFLWYRSHSKYENLKLKKA